MLARVMFLFGLLVASFFPLAFAQTAPNITSLSPTVGPVSPVGGSVTITGTGFGNQPGTVTFAGIQGSPTSWHDNQVVVPVPGTAPAGFADVVITANGLSSNAQSFLVIPTITQDTPESGIVGTTVVLTGTSFGDQPGSSSITFNGLPVSPISWSNTSIQVSVPNGAASYGSIVVTVNGFDTNGAFFLVFPNITKVSPSAGSIDSTVTITGTTFGTAPGFGGVTFNGTSATIQTWSDSSITVAVPQGATTGNVVVTNSTFLSSNGVNFTVPTAGSPLLQLSVNDAPLQVNLTSSQNLDWVHWGRIDPTTPDRKAGLSIPLISDYSLSSGGFVEPATGIVSYSWTDGNQQAAVTATTADLQNYNSGSGFQITVPADASVKTLNLYVVAFQTQLQIQASLSDGSAPTMTDTSVTDHDVGSKVYSIDYRAASPGQTLTVSVNSIGSGGWVGLEAATLTPHLPAVAVTSPAGGQSFQAPSTIPLLATASQFDSNIATVAFSGSDGSTLTAAGPPYAANWGPLQQGHYSTSASASDANSLTGTSSTVDFDVVGTGGSLNVSQAAPASSQSINLTSVGSADWVLWGNAVQLNTTAVPPLFDRKAGVVPMIATYKELGNHPLYADSEPVQFLYQDGTAGQTGEAYSSDVQVFGLNDGFELSVGADASLRTLQLYVGLGSGTATLKAFLSDGSAPVAIDQSFSTVDDLDVAVYSIAYNAASAGQTLTVRYTLSQDNGGGSVRLIGAALSGPPAALNPIITRMQPNAGSPGTAVTISGSGFGPIAGTAALTIGGKPAPVTFWSDAQIVGSVPLGLAPGSYPVAVYGVQGASFTVVPVTVAAIQPSAGSIGSQVSITGAGFGLQPGSVIFSGIPAPVVSWSDTKVVVTVPTSLSLGPATVLVNGTPAPPFNVAQIVFTDIQPGNGPAGTVFSILGSGFGWYNIPGAVVVGSVPATALTWTDTTITAIVPANLPLGLNPITVNGNPGLGFTVTAQTVSGPIITGLSAGAAVLNANLTIFGIGFGTAQGTVTLGAVTLPVTTWSDSSIEVTIPPGSGSGSLVVTTSAGQSSPAIPFTVTNNNGGTSLSPPAGPIGTTVTIAGTGFGATRGTVVFNGTVANVLNWNDSAIAVVVPPGASTGDVLVSTAAGIVFDAGTFTVTPGTPLLQFSVQDTPIAVNLSSPANLDWIHWGRVSLQQPDRKAGLTTPLISDYSLVAGGAPSRDNTNFITYAWSDGTPAAQITNGTDEISLSGVNNGFQITAPADTGVKSLVLYVGATQAGATLTASISDGSSTAIQDSSLSTLDQQNKVYQIDYRAASAGQTLTVTYTESQDLSGQSVGSISLQSAVLTPHLPSVSMVQPTSGSSYPLPGSVPLQGSAAQFDYAITNFQFLNSGNPVFDISSAPFIAAIDGLPAGHYRIGAQATDSGGLQSAPVTNEIDVIGAGGQLSETLSSAIGPVNLTAEGTADWVLWGRQDTTSVDRKFGVDPQISNYRVVGNHRSHQITNGGIGFTYHDADAKGTQSPTLNTKIQVYETGNGYEITVPADTTSRTLKLYVGADGARGKLQAFLSDGSANVLVDTSFDHPEQGANGVYAITYNAASSQQSLTVRYTLDFDYGHGDIDLEAATLSGPPVAIPRITSIDPPNEAGPGLFLDIFGSGFGAQTSNSSVLIDGIAASINFWSDSEIEVVVPNISESGMIVVVVNGLLSNAVPYTYEPGIRSAPQAIYITPDSITLAVGQSRPLSVVDQQGNAVPDATLSVDKPAIAVLQSANVEPQSGSTGTSPLPNLLGVAPGKVTITATSSLGTAVATATVYDPAQIPAGQAVTNWTLFPTTINDVFFQPTKGQPLNPGDPDLYLAESTGTIRALNSAGLQLWSVNSPTGASRPAAMPDGGMLFQDNNNVLTSYSGSGQLQWTSQPLPNGGFWPALNNTIYYDAGLNGVFVIDATNGQTRYTYPAPQAGTTTFLGHLEPNCTFQLPILPSSSILAVSVDGNAYLLQQQRTESFEWYGPDAEWMSDSSMVRPWHLIDPNSGNPYLGPATGTPTCTSQTPGDWIGVGAYNYTMTTNVIELTPGGPGHVYTTQDQDQNDQGPYEIKQSGTAWIPDPPRREGVLLRIPFSFDPTFYAFEYLFDYGVDSNGNVILLNGFPNAIPNFVAYTNLTGLSDGVGGIQVDLKRATQGRIQPDQLLRYAQGSVTTLGSVPQTLPFGLPSYAPLGDNGTFLQSFAGTVTMFDATTDGQLWHVSDPTFVNQWQVLSALADGTTLLEAPNFQTGTTTIAQVDLSGHFTNAAASTSASVGDISFYDADASSDQPGYIFVSDEFTGAIRQVALPSLPNTAPGQVQPGNNGGNNAGTAAKGFSAAESPDGPEETGCRGFDAEPNPAVMVPASGTAKVVITVPRGVPARLQARDATIITNINPSQLRANGNTVTLTAGSTPGTTLIDVYNSSTNQLIGWVLQVDVKAKKTITVQMFYINDPQLPPTVKTDSNAKLKSAYSNLVNMLPDADSTVADRLNLIYQRQANITFSVNPRRNYSYHYDLNGDGKLQLDTDPNGKPCYACNPTGEHLGLISAFLGDKNVNDFYTTWQAAAKPVFNNPTSTTNYFVGFYVNLVNPPPGDSNTVAISPAGDPTFESIIQTYYPGATQSEPATFVGFLPNTVAHEFGHLLGRGGEYHNYQMPNGTTVAKFLAEAHTRDNSNTLMQLTTVRNGTRVPCRLKRDDWNIMNFAPGSFIPGREVK